MDDRQHKGSWWVSDLRHNGLRWTTSSMLATFWQHGMSLQMMGSSRVVAQMVAAQAELHLQDNKNLGSTANIVCSDSAASATSEESRWAARQT